MIRILIKVLALTLTLFLFFLQNIVLAELLQQSLMLPMIIMWQFSLSVRFLFNTRRHNNASGFISMKNIWVIVSTGKAEMSLIPNSMMKPYTNISYKRHTCSWKTAGLLFWCIFCEPFFGCCLVPTIQTLCVFERTHWEDNALSNTEDPHTEWKLGHQINLDLLCVCGPGITHAVGTEICLSSHITGAPLPQLIKFHNFFNH